MADAQWPAVRAMMAGTAEVRFESGGVEAGRDGVSVFAAWTVPRLVCRSGPRDRDS